MRPSNELIEITIKTFSPYYEREMTVEDAKELISNCLNLLEALGCESRKSGEQHENKMQIPSSRLS